MIPQKPVRYLNAGEMICTGDDVLVSTVLGSCVAVVLHDKRLKVTGVNHYLLPDASTTKPLRFGESAILELVRSFKALGSSPQDIEAKILGGSLMHHNSQIPVGVQNIAIAKKILHKLNLSIVGEDTGSQVGRRVLVDALTGSVWIKKLTSPQSEGYGHAAQTHLIAIGASTGGTQAIQDVLLSLPAGLPPIVIVQHMPEDFTTTFAESLSRLTAFPVAEARQGELLQAGRAYLAPGNQHLRVKHGARGLWLDLRGDALVNGFRPSVDVLFESLVKVPRKIVAALLTGMGRDGARGLLELRRKGARTIAQDESTSIVYGMPKVAAEIGAAEKVLPLEEIAPRILKSLQAPSRRRAA